MRATDFPLSTSKETPANAEIISHQLMLRAGMIAQLGSGLYTWLPLGLRVLKKVENIVRNEMNLAGATELLMPSVQPAELWQQSGRWEQYGKELLRFKDRHNRDFCYGPTHEEVITYLAVTQLSSYKQLPMCYYQIQTKFRDEVRPRFGVMRAREFLMKDAYSFHLTADSLQQTYDTMYETYSRIFNRIGLKFRPVEADTGSIGGSASHEFHVLAETGEDALAISNTSDYAANVELAPLYAPTGERPAPTQPLTTIDTPDARGIQDICELLNIQADTTIKTLIVEADDESEHEVVALVLRGDHTLNEIKAEKHPLIKTPLTFADEARVKTHTGTAPGSVGLNGLNIPIVADFSTKNMHDFVLGPNVEGKHQTGGNWIRDFAEPDFFDLREIIAGDSSPCGEGEVEIVRGIEVGHIFQLGKKYAQTMEATVLNENGKAEVMTMGCYGIGVSRVVASSIEQNHDDNGIIWPVAIAPFEVALIGLNLQKSDAVRETCEQLYQSLRDASIDVFFDDRDMRPGAKFADCELIGIPYRVVIGDRGLENNMAEFRARTESDNVDIPLNDIINHVKAALHR